ncbi:MAG: Gfo/Idh/MocA family oxidoreductase [Clostridia bacterium]|nr:Gfo/Idh/MocA family oxidoreductase [Clostridia bacterium]
MIKAGIIGIGSMGRGHLNNYIKFMRENKGIELVAICDVDEKKFENYKADFNLEGVADGNFDFSKFRCYTNVDEMLEKETELDMVSVIVPTYLHCEISCKCLEKGINVFCEKPMALNLEECERMITTAKKAGKRLMIGQCLRFWGEYNYLKECVETERFGKVIAAYFYRGGSTPLWSFGDWYHKKELGGGAIYDQHIHDVDMVNYLFGMPEKVCSTGINYYEGSNFDAVSTNYIYPDGKVVNSQNDWCQACGFGAFYRVNFEKATLVYDNTGLHVADASDRNGKIDLEYKGTSYKDVEVSKESAYETEILYFADCIRNNKPVDFNTPEDSMSTIKLVHAEIESCEKKGEPVKTV